ncbi:DUF1838 family protein [Novosphingobium sp. YJ-S2-02]|uniref:DUF1838 family protein n=1 Tax=Novosphingobium aureum TaxID=2792964 RepID=A0A931MMK2_9SPHN|nr:DUF1838 family protein [Novosphingobium aureum]MBH0114236.1 DUF1838 family protein [Novosphingobium aureum]
MDTFGLSRRQSLGLGVGLAAGAAGLLGNSMVSAATGTKVPFRTRIDFKDPIWNRDTSLRMGSGLDPEVEGVGFIQGEAYGVRPNEPVRLLFKVDGYAISRQIPLGDGSWRRLLREIVFYRDPVTREILKTWENPYSGETVNVVPIANDPFNVTVSEWMMAPPSYGGLNKDKPARQPLLLDWEYDPTGMLVLRTGIDMQYPNALQPDKWPRESSGPVNRVSEHFITTIDPKDVENPDLLKIPSRGAWSRVTPWLPWMLMGTAPGHVMYFCNDGSVPGGIDALPRDVVAAASAMDKKWLNAPTRDEGASLSSLEHYARQFTPARVPPGWTPPQPPAEAKVFFTGKP